MIDLVIPLSKSDEPRFATFLKAMRAFGPYFNTNALIVPTAEMADRVEVRQWMGELSKLFKTCTIKPLNNTPQGGWPYACNQHFSWGIRYQEQQNTGNAWMWLELDCTPLEKGWLDTLESDHRLGAKPYTGHVGKSHEGRKYPDGTITQVLLEPHLEGVAIYPPDHGTACPLAKAPSQTVPFDIYCRFYTTQRGGQWLCHNSQKMIHRWRTVNYREENGQIVCDDLAAIDKGLSSAGVIDLTGKVLLHGCKDSSLTELILSKKGITEADLVQSSDPVIPVTAEVPATAPVFSPVQTSAQIAQSKPAIPDADEVIDGVWIKRGMSVMGVFLSLKQYLGIKDPTEAQPVQELTAPEATYQTEPEPPIQQEPSVNSDPFKTVDFYVSLAEKSEKKLRLGDVMNQESIPKDQRPALMDYLNSNGFDIKPPSFWFSLKKSA